jgi:hypothetical protein
MTGPQRRPTRRPIRGMVLAAIITLGPLLILPLGATAEELPVPPIPPEHPLLGDIAPVPNPDAGPPLTPVSNSPTVDIRQFRNRMYDPGQGFPPGSRYQTSEDRRPIQTPGLSINVPLQ